MIKKNGLGRGIDYLFENMDTANTENQIKNIHIEELCAGVYQPRRKFSLDNLEDLRCSIRNQGIIQPLIVRPVQKSDNERIKYEIIAGERRFRAAKLAGLVNIPAIVREYDDTEAMTVSLVENIQREDLNAIDEATALFKIKETYKLSQDDLAERLGKSRPSIANSLRLLTLEDSIQNSLIEGDIQAGHARTLLGIQDSEQRIALCKYTVQLALTVRELERAVEYWKEYGVLPTELSKYSEQNHTQESPQEETTTQKASPRKKYSPHPELKSIEDKLKTLFHGKVNVRGTEDKGSIKINYRNKDELLYILDFLSLDTNDTDKA